MEPKKSQFKTWTQIKLAQEFGLQRIAKCAALTEWLEQAKEIAITEIEKQFLAIIQSRTDVSRNIDLWSEKELEMKVIGPIISLVDYDIIDKNLGIILAKAFSGRDFGGIVGNYYLTGRPDGIIASGFATPQMPYFCFHEYKKQESASDDPIGQVLAAMLVAYEQNEPKRPIYGAYVSGRNWYFLVLKDKNYCVSDFYAVSHQINAIFRILCQLKNKIIQFLEEDKVTDS